MLLADAQTSGGLLIGVDEDKGNDLVVQLKQEGLSYTSIIGKVSNNDGNQNDLVILE
jgi:selenophosphate synthase